MICLFNDKLTPWSTSTNLTNKVSAQANTAWGGLTPQLAALTTSPYHAPASENMKVLLPTAIPVSFTFQFQSI